MMDTHTNSGQNKIIEAVKLGASILNRVSSQVMEQLRNSVFSPADGANEHKLYH